MKVKIKSLSILCKIKMSLSLRSMWLQRNNNYNLKQIFKKHPEYTNIHYLKVIYFGGKETNKTHSQELCLQKLHVIEMSLIISLKFKAIVLKI